MGEAPGPVREDVRTLRDDRQDQPRIDEPPPTRPKALSPDLPDLPDEGEMCLPPVPWGTSSRVTKPTETSTGLKTKRVRTSPGKMSLAQRVLTILETQKQYPPSPYDRWRAALDGSQLKNEAENNDAPHCAPQLTSQDLAGRTGADGDASERNCNTQDTIEPLQPVTKTAPPPTLTWDQHAVFLQFPPTKVFVADDLPRGLAPGTLSKLYRRVEHEQKRYLKWLVDSVSNDSEKLKRYRAISGVDAHQLAERKARRCAIETCFSTTCGTAPRRCMLVAKDVPLHDFGNLSSQQTERVELVPLGFEEHTVSLQLVTQRTVASPAVSDAVGVLASSDASAPSLSSKRAADTTNPQPSVDAVLTERAFELFACSSIGRDTSAWDVPIEVVRVGANSHSDANSDTGTKTLRVLDPLPPRDVIGATRARSETYWERCFDDNTCTGTVTTGTFKVANRVISIVSDKCVGQNVKCVADYLARKSGDESEELSLSDVCRIWAHTVCRPSDAKVTLARVAVADGTVVSLDTMDRGTVYSLISKAVDLPPLGSYKYSESNDGLENEQELSTRDNDGDDRDDNTSAGGPTDEPWFNSRFDPCVATASVYQILKSLLETTEKLPGGRYVLSKQVGGNSARLWKGEDGGDSEDVSQTVGLNTVITNPAVHAKRRRGRPTNTAETAGDTGKRKRKGAGFAGVEGARVETEIETESEALPVNAPTRDVRPAPGPPDDDELVPGLVYDLYKSYKQVLDDEEQGFLSDNVSDTQVIIPPDVLPHAEKTSIKIKRTFSPKGEPPAPGARRARKMWMSLLAPPAGEFDVVSSEHLVGSGDTMDPVGVYSQPLSSRSQQHTASHVVAGVRYCHKFAHLGSCRSDTCPFPHLSLAEATRRKGVITCDVNTEHTTASQSKGLYGQLVSDTGRASNQKQSAWFGGD